MLGVYIHQTFAQFLQQGELYGCIVNESATLACRGEFTTDNAVALLVFDIVVAEEVLHVVAREVELGLNDALVGALLDGLQVGALTQQHADSPEDDAFACTCFSGNHRETLTELDVEAVDQRKVLDI